MVIMLPLNFLLPLCLLMTLLQWLLVLLHLFSPGASSEANVSPPSVSPSIDNCPSIDDPVSVVSATGSSPLNLT